MGEDLVDEFRRSGVMMNEKKRKKSVILNNRLMKLDQSLSTSPQVSFIYNFFNLLFLNDMV